MKLTLPQKIVVYLGGLIIVGMLAYPPWLYTVMLKAERRVAPAASPAFMRWLGEENTGASEARFSWADQTSFRDVELLPTRCYSWVFLPPSTLSGGRGRAHEPTIDISRLAVQCDGPCCLCRLRVWRPPIGSVNVATQGQR